MERDIEGLGEVVLVGAIIVFGVLCMGSGILAEYYDQGPFRQPSRQPAKVSITVQGGTVEFEGRLKLSSK